jgi:hypothetical protein
MPTTSQNITTIIQQLNGWDRDGQHGVLPFYNEANNILLQNENEEMVKVDNATGLLPLLTTLAGQFKYSLPSGVWRIDSILVLIPTESTYGINPLSTFQLDDRPVKYVKWAGHKFLQFQAVRCYDEDTLNAGILFQLDPGDSTDFFYYYGYVKPNQITAETIQSQIPGRYHMSHLIPATIKLLEGIQNGTMMQARQEINTLIKPDFWNEMNKGGKQRSGFIRPKRY